MYTLGLFIKKIYYLNTIEKVKHTLIDCTEIYKGTGWSYTRVSKAQNDTKLEIIFKMK